LNKKAGVASALVLLAVVILVLFLVYARPAPPDGKPPPKPLPELPTIYIRDDANLTDIIQRDGNVYTLTKDIFNYTISVEKNDTIIDGAGYTLQGALDIRYYYGIDLSGSNNITIRNFRISGFADAILGFGCSNITITGNNITGNHGGGIHLSGTGIRIIDNKVIGNAGHGISINNEVTGNLVEDNGDNGIQLLSSSGTILRNNDLQNNTINIDDISGKEDIDDSNKVEGKAVYYWKNVANKVVPSDAGLVVLFNCQNITVKDLDLAPNNEVAVMLLSTTNSIISKNNMTENVFGIIALDSSNNTISENYLADNHNSGIKLYSGSNFQIIQNNIANNAGNGIFTNSSYGNTIAWNTFASNIWFGVEIKNGNDNVVSQNDFFKNGAGIQDGGGGVDIIGGGHNLVVGNVFKENDGFGVRVSGSINSSFYHNDFINNINYNNGKIIDGLQASNPWFGGPESNIWDDGASGNYWSDYLTRYANATEIGNTGIGNTPFFINPGNIDRYPVLNPFSLLS
jgi:parallel beta-helix repeat protein